VAASKEALAACEERQAALEGALNETELAVAAKAALVERAQLLSATFEGLPDE